MTDSHSSSSKVLEEAPDDVKLAVDLIYLLESHAIETDTALSAIDIVKHDLLTKKAASSSD
ncbi:hypothetical protein BZG73_03130 [Salinivibrio siamensis]|uniref:Primosomal protein n=1 Tax=Salinivibrio siamensis TaxID=414286 RepID=A0ABX3KE40_9GAMM|nr:MULTISPECIES: DUF2496 domain-containing protein [Salinivibrio]OOE67133.1 hypothetical protein BZG20_06710 [Salinivibrio sp. IB868]OOE77316.1 hypothetical protein BZG22_02335 [Salinivibrio sp. IB870]OOE87201.1 hypothetical protein BZG73_03130 [Salinivibrio siamensis]